MKLILKEDVSNLGTAGELVDVKDGYGRNYLIPQKKAVLATDGMINAIEEERRQAERKQQMDRASAEQMAKELSETSLTLPTKAGEDGKLFGTVTNHHVAEALQEKGYTVDRKKINLDDEIRYLGEYTASVGILDDIKAELKIWVVKA